MRETVGGQQSFTHKPSDLDWSHWHFWSSLVFLGRKKAWCGALLAMHQPSYIPPLHALLGRSLWLGLVLVDLVKRRNEAFPDFSGAIETRKGIDPVPSVLNCQKKGYRAVVVPAICPPYLMRCWQVTFKQRNSSICKYLHASLGASSQSLHMDVSENGAYTHSMAIWVGHIMIL